MTKIEIKRPGESSTIELKKPVDFTHSIITKNNSPHRSHQVVAWSSSLNLFSSISKLTKVLHLLVCGRCYLNNLSLKIALAARVNKVLREFAGKDLVDCYEVV